MPATSRADGAPPTGTVTTFLFTDIEGSTALWEQFPAAMQPALARHDALLRQVIGAAAGCIVKTTGDGVYAAFGSATDALAACLAAQRALQAPGDTSAAPGAPLLALRVRMGLHTGPAELRDADYFGVAVSRAARIMAAAHGGQILLSTATADLVRDYLPAGVTLREMGEHRLKGLLDPERLLQVVAPDLPADFPPLASLNAHSLPAERDAFVGRREPLDELARRLAAGTRLISILGIGGTGKTRLVTRFGWRALGEFPGGVWFCDLAPARSLDGIVHAVAQGLDLPLGKDDPVTRIGRAIAGRGKCLVILDNFEQVARHVEDTLGRWLNRAAEARFLVTTREVLGVPGEEVLALPPLAQADAATLFLRRAEAAQPGWKPGAEEHAAIAPLVKLLEGLPLAIELAAARVRVMSPRTLLLRMSERFKLLSSTGGRVDRQATLRAVFDWSWDLLSVPEKAALAQLSVFAGGFTLAAVEAVLDLSAYAAAPWPMDALQSLVHKSFVRQASDARFDLLVSVQEYAAEHLRTAERYAGSGPDALRAAEARHGAYFAGLDEKAAIADACADLDNFVVACRRAVARGDADMAAQALANAWAGLRLRGPFRVGVELASPVRILPGIGAAAAARTLVVAGHALSFSGKDTEAYVAFESALERARAAGDRRLECRAHITMGEIDQHAGRMDAGRTHLDAALVIGRELQDGSLKAGAHHGLGTIEYYLGRPAAARAHYEAALALTREAGDRRREGIQLGELGNLCFLEGKMDESRSCYESALAVARGEDDRRLESNMLCNLGSLYQVQGRLAEALGHLDAALALARDLGHAQLESVVLCNLGAVCDSLNRLDEALAHFMAALAIAGELGDRRAQGLALGGLGLLHAHRGDPDEARRCLESGEALLRAVSDLMSLGVLLCNRSETEHLEGMPEAASAALAAAAVIADEIAAGADSELGIALARVRDLLGPARPAIKADSS